MFGTRFLRRIRFTTVFWLLKRFQVQTNNTPPNVSKSTFFYNLHQQNGHYSCEFSALIWIQCYLYPLCNRIDWGWKPNMFKYVIVEWNSASAVENTAVPCTTENNHDERNCPKTRELHPHSERMRHLRISLVRWPGCFSTNITTHNALRSTLLLHTPAHNFNSYQSCVIEIWDFNIFERMTPNPDPASPRWSIWRLPPAKSLAKTCWDPPPPPPKPHVYFPAPCADGVSDRALHVRDSRSAAWPKVLHSRTRTASELQTDLSRATNMVRTSGTSLHRRPWIKGDLKVATRIHASKDAILGCGRNLEFKFRRDICCR